VGSQASTGEGEAAETETDQRDRAGLGHLALLKIDEFDFSK
jgi:hypothetical protein